MISFDSLEIKVNSSARYFLYLEIVLTERTNLSDNFHSHEHQFHLHIHKAKIEVIVLPGKKIKILFMHRHLYFECGARGHGAFSIQ